MAEMLDTLRASVAYVQAHWGELAAGAAALCAFYKTLKRNLQSIIRAVIWIRNAFKWAYGAVKSVTEVLNTLRDALQHLVNFLKVVRDLFLTLARWLSGKPDPNSPPPAKAPVPRIYHRKHESGRIVTLTVRDGGKAKLKALLQWLTGAGKRSTPAADELITAPRELSGAADSRYVYAGLHIALGAGRDLHTAGLADDLRRVGRRSCLARAFSLIKIVRLGRRGQATTKIDGLAGATISLNTLLLPADANPALVRLVDDDTGMTTGFLRLVGAITGLPSVASRWAGDLFDPGRLRSRDFVMA